MKGNILTDILHIFLVLRWSGINLSILKFFVIAPIVTFEDMCYIHYQPFFIQKQKWKSCPD